MGEVEAGGGRVEPEVGGGADYSRSGAIGPV